MTNRMTAAQLQAFYKADGDTSVGLAGRLMRRVINARELLHKELG